MRLASGGWAGGPPRLRVEPPRRGRSALRMAGEAAPHLTDRPPRGSAAPAETSLRPKAFLTAGINYRYCDYRNNVPQWMKAVNSPGCPTQDTGAVFEAPLIRVGVHAR